MALFHYFDVVTNTRGDSLVGYQVAVRNGGTVVPIYADANGTPIATQSGIANVALTDSAGNFSIYVDPGTYDLEIRTPAGIFLKRVSNVPMTGGPSGEDGNNAGSPIAYREIAIAGQTAFPRNEADFSTVIRTDGGTGFDYLPATVAVFVDGALQARDVDYSAPGNYGKITFTTPRTAGQRVEFFGYVSAGAGAGGSLGADEVDVASYPGTTEADDPKRWDHDNERFKNAQLDVTDPNSPNHGKAVRFFPGGGSGQLVLKDRDGNDVPQLTGVEAKFNAAVGDWLLDRWSQNGRFEPDNASAVLVDNKNDPGNWMSGVVIRAHGCRFRRAPRYHHRPYILCCDPVASSATTDPQTGIDTQSDVFVGNRIEGYPIVLGENHWRGYGQHANDVQVNAVTDFYAELIGLGSRSDVLYIGARSVGGGLYNAHNKRVKYHVIADGYNKNNRNVVSTIDVDGEEGFIEAVRFSKPGGPAANDNMDPNTGVGAPGVHDAEPNASFTTQPIYRNSNVVIKCRDVGSACALFLPDNNSFPGFEAYNITRTIIADDSDHGGFIIQYGNKPNIPYAVEISAKVTNSIVPYEVISGGAVITGYARDCPNAAFHGYFGFTASDLNIDGFMYQRCGGASGQVIENRGTDGGSFKNGVWFRECPNRIGIRNMPQDSAAQITRNLVLDNVRFDAGMVNSIYTDTTHDLRAGSCREVNVNRNGNTDFRFPIVGATVRSIPTSGQYRQGDTMTVTGEPGSPRTIMALTTNAAGTTPTFGVQDYVQPFAAPVATGFDANFFTLTNIINSPNGRLIGTAPMARALGGFTDGYNLFVRAPSGSTGIYVGMSYSNNPTSFTQIAFGAWIGDQTGGVGRVVGIGGGASAGTPTAFVYGDRIQVTMQANNTSTVNLVRANGTTTTVYSSGLGGGNFYPVILMGTPGEQLLVQVTS